MAWQAESGQSKRACKAASLMQAGGVDLDAVPACERQPGKEKLRQTEPACRQGFDVWRPSHGTDRAE